MDVHGASDNRRVRDSVEVSFCVVNTSERELLLRGLDAIARERDALPFAERGARARQRLARRLGRGGARARRRSTS